jgi:hypothetical protein
MLVIDNRAVEILNLIIKAPWKLSGHNLHGSSQWEFHYVCTIIVKEWYINKCSI